jgi:hypothetical protein
MITSLLLAAALVCPLTVTKNYTTTWTKLDENARAGAKVRCGFLYRKSPCLVKFIKLGERRHQAVCGAPREAAP